MCFSKHYNDIQDSVNTEMTGISHKVTLYGFINESSTLSFWKNTKLDGSMIRNNAILVNPLYINSFEYDVGNIVFESQCVGYAVDGGYDSIIIDNGDDKSYIIFDSVTLSNAKKLYNQIDEAKKAPPRGVKADVLLANTVRLSPDRVKRGMKEIRTNPPKITNVIEKAGNKYFRAEYNFKSVPSVEFRRQWGYADVSKNKEYINELYCTCKDFYYRLYAPYIAAGLATWDLPPKYKANRQINIISKSKNNKTPVNTWTDSTNPDGKLFLCKHLWAFIAYYITGDKGNKELSDEEIDDVVTQFFGDVEDGVEPSDPDYHKKYGKLYKRAAGKQITQAGTKPSKRKKSTDLTTTDTTDIEELEVDSEE